MGRFRSGLLVLLPLLALGLPASAAGQGLRSVGITPTYQGSIQLNERFLPGSEYRAYGIMVGWKRSGAWWNPHVWFQRYHMDSYLRGDSPEDGSSTMDGWFVSVGPAIQFLRSDTWTGEFLPQVGLTSRGAGELEGGAGLHLGLDAGFFQPQVFGRWETRGPRSYWTLGLGVTVEVVWAEDEGSIGFWR